MKTKFNPIITVSKIGAENIAKIMNGELKSSISKEKLKSILNAGLNMKKNLKIK